MPQTQALQGPPKNRRGIFVFNKVPSSATSGSPAEIVGIAKVSWVVRPDSQFATDADRIAGKARRVKSEDEFWVVSAHLAGPQTFEKGDHSYFKLFLWMLVFFPSVYFKDPVTEEEFTVRYIVRAKLPSATDPIELEQPIKIIPTDLDGATLTPLHFKGTSPRGASCDVHARRGQWSPNSSITLFYSFRAPPTADVASVALELVVRLGLPGPMGVDQRIGIERTVCNGGAGRELHFKIATSTKLAPSMTLGAIDISYEIRLVALYPPPIPGMPAVPEFFSPIPLFILPDVQRVIIPPGHDDVDDQARGAPRQVLALTPAPPLQSHLWHCPCPFMGSPVGQFPGAPPFVPGWAPPVLGARPPIPGFPMMGSLPPPTPGMFAVPPPGYPRPPVIPGNMIPPHNLDRRPSNMSLQSGAPSPSLISASPSAVGPTMDQIERRRKEELERKEREKEAAAEKERRRREREQDLAWEKEKKEREAHMRREFADDRRSGRSEESARRLKEERHRVQREKEELESRLRTDNERPHGGEERRRAAGRPAARNNLEDDIVEGTRRLRLTEDNLDRLREDEGRFERDSVEQRDIRHKRRELEEEKHRLQAELELMKQRAENERLKQELEEFKRKASEPSSASPTSSHSTQGLAREGSSGPARPTDRPSKPNSASEGKSVSEDEIRRAYVNSLESYRNELVRHFRESNTLMPSRLRQAVRDEESQKLWAVIKTSSKAKSILEVLRTEMRQADAELDRALDPSGGKGSPAPPRGHPPPS
ncbi:hypothetical protein DFJ73DRAFT_884048 [Zopfochytrium polystomum]|nr:hypothetical protein DFJ73DRAFT_884048 [Zopfochytrium polystomum]